MIEPTLRASRMPWRAEAPVLSNRRAQATRFRSIAALAAVAITLISTRDARYAGAQTTGPLKATVVVHADRPGSTINKNIYGHFAEHLGRGIYDGLWVGENSSIPNIRGIRRDVIDALKRLNVPLLRWPGGCFADEYHWRDGIGPRDRRPRRINASWGGIETNAFGTHEFMDLCELIGAAPYIGGNIGSGSPQEMMEWLEYMTSDSDSALASLRRQNGREKPWKVEFFGVGNETWGCGGNMRAEFYADEYRRFATFLRSFSGPIQRIASGGLEADYHWTDVLMSQAARQMQGFSLHMYTLPTGDWNRKGSATQFDEQQWHSTLVRTLRMAELIEKHSAIMDKYDPEKRVGLMVDEWGTWYDPEPGNNLGALYQQNSIRDAIVAAINLNIFNQHSDRVRMANIAQMINVLQAVILTNREGMILTPTYHVFEMYKVHQGATLLPVESNSPDYALGSSSVSSVHVSASRNEAGAIHVSLVNLDPNRSAEVQLTVSGVRVKRAGGRVLTAPAMNSVNTFDRPDFVKPAPFEAIRIDGDRLTLTLPSKSVLVLQIR